MKLKAEGICFSYYDRQVLKNIDVELGLGNLIGLIGPNGSGKTTLIKVLNGFLRPEQGWVELDGRDLRSMSRAQIAYHVAVVPQDLHMPFAFTAQEMVMLGRTAYISRLRGRTDQDQQVVEEVMRSTSTLQFAARIFNELSGGEQRRVMVAIALAQQPSILLLDEPTVHLDIRGQIEILELMKKLNRETSMAILAAMHDLNLTSLYFDNIILLDEGAIVAQGTPEEVLEEGHISYTFGANLIVQKHPTANVPLVVLLPGSPSPLVARGLHGGTSPCNAFCFEADFEMVKTP